MTWSDLVNAAVIGTSRASAAPDAAALAGLGAAARLATAAAAGLDSDDDQIRLLHQVAALSLARRAGYRPPLAPEHLPPAVAEPDARPQVSQAARQRLAELLDSASHELTGEWLRLLAQAGRPGADGEASRSVQRPPDVLLPALLTVATAQQSLRDLVAPVAGPLVTWLAAFNEDWAWASPVAATAPETLLAWETGSSAARRALLARLRATDPAAGRSLVASTWQADPYRDKLAFIEALHAGLGMADEQLAEQGLRDRRIEVRRVAADLLARLPGSRFSQRAATRAAAAVQVERRALRHRMLVDPPQAVTPAMAADGLDGSPPRQTSIQAWLLRQIVAAAPAGLWTAHSGLQATELLGLASRTQWSGPLLAGWTEAAIRDADVPWLRALLDEPAADQRSLGTASRTAGTRSAATPTLADHGERHAARELRLLSAMPPPALDEWLCENPGSPLARAALERVPPPWSTRLSDQVRSVLAQVARADPGYSPGPRALLRLGAARLEPPEPAGLDPASVHERLAGSWNDHLMTLSVRAAMRRELAEEPVP